MTNIWGYEQKIRHFRMRKRELENELKYAKKSDREEIEIYLARISKKIINWKFNQEM